MNTVVHIVRHGEVHNPKQILYGRLPGFRLSINGKNIVRETAERLSARKIKKIYSSPLLRARQTSLIISETIGKKVSFSGHLTEIGLILQGMPLSEYKDKVQPYIFDDEYVKKGQESVEQVKKRFIGFLHKTVKKHKGEEICVVTHGDPIVIFYSHVVNSSFDWNFKKKYYVQTGKWMSFIYNHKTGIWGHINII